MREHKRRVERVYDGVDVRARLCRVKVGSEPGGREDGLRGELVAETPHAHRGAGEVRDLLDAGVRQRYESVAGVLEDLGDRDDVEALLAGSEHVRDPVGAEVGVTGTHLHRGVHVAAVEDRYVQTFLGVEAFVLSHEVPGELRLREPLRLEVDGDQVLRERVAARDEDHHRQCRTCPTQHLPTSSL